MIRLRIGLLQKSVLKMLKRTDNIDPPAMYAIKLTFKMIVTRHINGSTARVVATAPKARAWTPANDRIVQLS